MPICNSNKGNTFKSEKSQWLFWDNSNWLYRIALRVFYVLVTEIKIRNFFDLLKVKRGLYRMNLKHFFYFCDYFIIFALEFVII